MRGDRGCIGLHSGAVADVEYLDMGLRFQRGNAFGSAVQTLFVDIRDRQPGTTMRQADRQFSADAEPAPVTTATLPSNEFIGRCLSERVNR